MGKGISRGRSRRRRISTAARFLRREGRKLCAAALCTSLIIGNIANTAVAADKDADKEIEFKLSRGSLYKALQEAVLEGNTVEEELPFEGEEAEAYEALLEADGDLYELTSAVKNRDKDLKLRVFARLDQDMELESAYEVDGSEEIIFLLSNTSEKTQSAVVCVDDKYTEPIQVVPGSAVEVAGNDEDSEAPSGKTSVSAGSAAGGGAGSGFGGGTGSSSGSGGSTGGGTGSSSGSGEEMTGGSAEITIEPEKESEHQEPGAGKDSEVNVVQGNDDQDENDNKQQDADIYIDVDGDGSSLNTESAGETEKNTGTGNDTAVEISPEDKTDAEAGSENKTDAEAGSDSDGEAETGSGSDFDSKAESDSGSASGSEAGGNTESEDEAESGHPMASISIHPAYRVMAADAATPSSATKSDADEELLEGILYNAVRLGNSGAVALVTDAADLRLDDPALINLATPFDADYEFTAELDDVIVHVYANEGVLPENAKLQVTELREDDSDTAEQFQAAKDALDADGTEYNGIMALDISFYDEEGNEIEPDGNVQVMIEMNTAILPEDIQPESLAVKHLAETAEGIQVKTVADITDEVAGTLEMKEESAVLAAEFQIDSFSAFTITWLADNRAVSAPSGTIEAKVYLRYSNELPNKINGSDSAGSYGPSGNNVPYITVTVNLDKVNQQSDCGSTYNWNSNAYWYYYSIESDNRYGSGSKEAAANYWKNVIYPAIEENDREALDAVFGGEEKYIGYVLKRENDGWHIDGILTEDPPVYVVELYDRSTAGNPCLFAISNGAPGVAYADFEEKLKTELGITEFEYATEQDDLLVIEYQKDGRTYRTTISPRNENSHIYPQQNGFGYKEMTKNIYYLCQLEMVTEVMSGNLKITKSVDGNAKDKDEHFEFTLTSSKLDGEYDLVYTGNNSSCNVNHTSSVSFADGKAFVYLKDGESVLIKNLPVNQTIAIQETRGAYTSAVDVTVDGVKSSNGVEVVIKKDEIHVQFKNTQTISVPTGILANNRPYLMMLALVALGITGFTGSFSRKKRRNRR